MCFQRCKLPWGGVAIAPTDKPDFLYDDVPSTVVEFEAGDFPEGNESDDASIESTTYAKIVGENGKIAYRYPKVLSQKIRDAACQAATEEEYKKGLEGDYLLAKSGCEKLCSAIQLEGGSQISIPLGDETSPVVGYTRITRVAAPSTSMRTRRQILNVLKIDSLKEKIEKTKQAFSQVEETSIDRKKESICEYRDLCLFIRTGCFADPLTGDSLLLSVLSPEEKEIVDKPLRQLESPKSLSEKDLMQAAYLTTYGYKAIPSLAVYEEKHIKREDFSALPPHWRESPLLASLFKGIGLSSNEVNGAYAKYKDTNNIMHLTNLNRKFTSKVDELAERFNKLFMQKGQKYKFELRFENNLISFGLSLDETPLDYPKQSTGFQYFFDLFFNYLYNTEIEPGDILIMDEPGTHLHVSGQEELAAFLREFALAHHLTIVLVTHSPFFIDPDYLEELRIVSRSEKGVQIINEFHVASEDYPDTLAPIVAALTTRSSVVLNPENRKIFVEGITDYEYLTAFKIVYGKDDAAINNLVFLPVNGLGKPKEMEGRIKDLKRIDRSPNLLVDGDHAGQQFKRISEKNGGSAVSVYSLSEINPEFKDIEHLFTDEERERFALLPKKWAKASALKSKIIRTKGACLSQTTQDNFRKVLKWLSENI